MRWDKPSSGDDDPDQRRGPDRVNWDYFRDGPRPDWTKPGYMDNRQFPQEADVRTDKVGEGTGWPIDKSDVMPDKPKTPEERVKELEAENKSLRSENTRLTGSYEHSLQELQHRNNELSSAKNELANTKADRSRLIDTNSRLVRDNLEMRKKTEASSAYDRNANATAAQSERIEKKPHRRNWFPTDKMGNLGGAVAGVAGTYAVMAGRVASKEEAFGLACAGAGMATLALGRELTDKVNAWRDKRAEKKNADRQ